MSEEPLYYSRKQLAARAEVSMRTFTKHESLNVGNLSAARETHPGIGMVYKASSCRRYLGLVAAGASRPTAKLARGAES